jgi:hypothetical protein
VSDPVQQHYLPKKAYLSFFETLERPGYVWLYQRRKPPVLVNIERVAKERHLYSFVDAAGNYDVEIEQGLATLEGDARPILERFNKSEAPVGITAWEKEIVSWFIAYQAVRTPAQRRVIDVLTEGLIGTTESAALFYRGPQLHRAVQQTLETQVNRPLQADSMLAALDMADVIFPSIAMKRWALLRAASPVVTSDHPVALVPDPRVPPAYGTGGFLMAQVILPVGRHCILAMVNDDDVEPPTAPDEPIIVGSRQLEPRWLDRLNAHTIAHAEKYVFASENLAEVRRIFDATERPLRVSVISPFKRK